MTPENTNPEGRCRECRRAWARANSANRERTMRWRAANPERVKEHARRSHANPNAKAKTKEWREKNPAKVRAARRRSTERRRETKRAYDKERNARIEQEAPGSATARVKAWAAANPDRARSNHRRGESRVQARRWGVAMIDYTAAQCAERMAYFGNRCFYCGGAFEHVEHLKPMSQGGPDMLANLRPSCVGCNVRKSNHWPI